MKVHYTKKDAKKAKFVLSDVDFAVANAIRRAVMAYVPSMAVEKVVVYENTSPVYEEMIAQRLGLVPLTTDLKTYVVPDECKCGGEGCARCQVSMILEKSGPGVVYSGDIKSRDPKIKPVYDKMPITMLREGQTVKMEMVASLGYMGQNAKFQSCLASYKQVSEREFDFFVESYTDVPAYELVELALEALEAKAADLEDAFLHPNRERKVKKALKKEIKVIETKKGAEAEKKGEEKKAEKKEKKAKARKEEKPKKEAKPKKASKAKKSKE